MAVTQLRVGPLRKGNLELEFINYAYIIPYFIFKEKSHSEEAIHTKLTLYTHSPVFLPKVEWHKVLKDHFLSDIRFILWMVSLYINAEFPLPSVSESNGLLESSERYIKNKTIKSCRQYVHQDINYKLGLDCCIISINRLLKRVKKRLKYLDNSYRWMDKTLSNFLRHSCNCSQRAEKSKWSDIKHKTTSLKIKKCYYMWCHCI